MNKSLPIIAALLLGFAAWRYWSRNDGEAEYDMDVSDYWNQWTDESMPANNANRAAFLTMIATAEGTENQPDPYRVLYAYSGVIQSFDDHPANMGWPGVRLSDAQCRGAGLGPGCVSTAAGRYQINKPTFKEIRNSVTGIPPGFGPDAQDAIALGIVAKMGALGDVDAGRIESAISKCRKRWASLPGANYEGQGMRSLGSVLAAYQRAGGSLAA